MDHYENQVPPFTTFTRHLILENGESVIKMFSSEELSDGDLSALFHNTSWIHRKSWQAFPKLFPVPMNADVDEDWPSIILHGFEPSSKAVSGIFYANAFENVISVRRHGKKCA